VHSLSPKQSDVNIGLFQVTPRSRWICTLILWASGLSVQSAWCIATETESALKEGNYVKGTVLLNLKKRTSEQTAFLDELYPQVEDEVKKQLTLMHEIDDQDDPNFGDTDLQLAAYAAALRVLTQYSAIEDFDIERELSRGQKKDEPSPIVKIIENAVKVATAYLIPRGIQPLHWRKLSAEERFYLKGLDIQAAGDYRNSVYQELARGFGIKHYAAMLGSERANKTRLKTAVEFARQELGTSGFGSSLVRQILLAIYEAKQSDSISKGKNYLKTELPDYWNQRQLIIHLLDYLASFQMTLESWREEGDLARLLKGAIQNDHV
jgi:hypothetical protein